MADRDALDKEIQILLREIGPKDAANGGSSSAASNARGVLVWKSPSNILGPQRKMELMLIVYGRPEAHCYKTMAEKPA
jgi:hypothetical protein